MWLTQRRIEIIAVVLISIASVASAWCAYQSARWGGVQSASYSRASAVRVESLREANLANRQLMIDVNLFLAYSSAASVKNTAYSAFVAQRFPKRLALANRAWLATRPFTNPQAPSSPFVMPAYHLDAQDEADRLETKAGALFDQGSIAREVSDRYILMTVLFASVSFLAGVGSKFDHRGVVLTALGLGVAVVVGAAVFLIGYPIH
jgi:hypothetical protein